METVLGIGAGAGTIGTHEEEKNTCSFNAELICQEKDPASLGLIR
jgi:hypothetical protein